MITFKNQIMKKNSLTLEVFNNHIFIYGLKNINNKIQT
jgi:hypothetical protein